MSLPLQPVVQILGEPPCLKVISGLGRLDHEPWDLGNLEPDGPFGILVVRPFVKHDPAISPEVQEILVVRMGGGQPAPGLD